MTDYCPGCRTKIRWYHKRDKHNGAWHYRCWDSNEKGYFDAKNFAENECRVAHIKSPWDSYRERNNLKLGNVRNS